MACFHQWDSSIDFMSLVIPRCLFTLIPPFEQGDLEILHGKTLAFSAILANEQGHPTLSPQLAKTRGITRPVTENEKQSMDVVFSYCVFVSCIMQ